MDAQVSLEFYKYLCDVIGTKEVVKARRQILYAAETNGGPEKRRSYVLNSGSKAEGLDLSGSDVDIMQVLGGCSVYESSDEVDHSLCTIPLIMDTDDTSPGFTKLYVHDVSGDARDHLIDECCVSIENKRYISSAFYRNYLIDHADIDEPLSEHGPCVSPNDEVDIAVSFHCNRWISQAHDFITRTKYSWSSKGVLETILQFGVLFVPIGSKRSPDTELEWRISFSFAEKLLILSFNHVQLLCYALLKITLKELIKKNMPKSSADLLCSYFLKTIMFWLCEETDVSQWKPETLLSCFNMAFNRLLYCVENKTLLHYFIPENNLFKDRFTNEQNDALMSNLKDLLNIGWTCLLDTETLKSFSERIAPSLTSCDIRTVSYVSFLPLLVEISCNFKNTNGMSMSVYRCTRSGKNRFFLYRLSLNNQSIAQYIESDKRAGNSNKQKYNRYRKQMCHLLIGTNHDAVSGWLLLATFFMSNKQYLKSQRLVDFCLSKFSGHDHNMILPYTITEEGKHKFNLIGSKLGPCNKGSYLACKNFTAMHVYINKSKFIDPDDISWIDSKHFEQFEVVSPLICAHYLKLLCGRQIGWEHDLSTDDMMKILISTTKFTKADKDCLNHIFGTDVRSSN